MPRPLAFITPAALGTLASISLIAGWSALHATQPQPAAAQSSASSFPPPAPAAPTQYALLTHYQMSYLTPGLGGNWRFEDPGAVYDAKALAQHFGLQPGDEYLPARIVTSVAAQGWELVTHTDAATTTSGDVRDGTTTSSGSTSRIEQWWFKKK
jgi:hypothetical protein